MGWRMFQIDVRLYRYSAERRPSGRPVLAQFRNTHGEWRDVRNIDVLDGIWRIADGLPARHLQKGLCDE